MGSRLQRAAQGQPVRASLAAQPRGDSAASQGTCTELMSQLPPTPGALSPPEATL